MSVRASATPVPWQDRAIGRVRRYWYPLIALTRREMQKRYAASMLGVSWTVLQPLVLIAVYAFVFGFVLKPAGSTDGGLEFVLFMLSGMLPYLALADGIQRATFSMREDRALLDRDTFPAEVIPASRVLSASVTEIVGLAVLLVIQAFSGQPLKFWLLALPLLFVVRVILTCGIAWFTSILAVFISDLAEALTLILTAWLFLTPIFYTEDAVPAALRWLLVLNPLHQVVSAYRAVLDGQAPDVGALSAVLWAIGLGLLGSRFFRRALDRAKDFL